MISHFKIACAAVATMSLLMVVYGRSSSQPEPAPVAASDVQTPDLTQAKKELADAMAMFTEAPKLVQTETIVPEAMKREVMVTPPPEEKPKKIDHGPCAKNTDRKRKVWINKHQWRCLK